MSNKPTLATVWLDGCSGCHMSFLDIDERILDLAAQADLVLAPETAVPLLPGQLEDFAPGYWAALQGHFAAPGRAALVGVPLGDFEHGYTNSVAGLSAATAAGTHPAIIHSPIIARLRVVSSHRPRLMAHRTSDEYRLTQSRQKYQSTAKSVPVCAARSKVSVFGSHPSSHGTTIRCPVLETGINSVAP